MPLDLPAIEELYERYGPIVYGRCLKLMRGDGEEARDAAQEVFLQVLKARSRFRGQAKPSSWIYRIATNVCLKRIRDRPEAGVAGISPEDLPSARNPESESHWRALAARLISASDERTLTVALHYFVDGMTQDEIAEVTGISRRTIGKRLKRFRATAEELRD